MDDEKTEARATLTLFVGDTLADRGIVRLRLVGVVGNTLLLRDATGTEYRESADRAIRQIVTGDIRVYARDGRRVTYPPAPYPNEIAVVWRP